MSSNDKKKEMEVLLLKKKLMKSSNTIICNDRTKKNEKVKDNNVFMNKVFLVVIN